MLIFFKSLKFQIFFLYFCFTTAAFCVECNQFDIAKPNEDIIIPDRFRALEEDTKERKEWLKFQNQKTDEWISENASVEKEFWEKNVFIPMFEKEQRLVWVQLENGYTLETMDRGLNLPNEVVLKKDGEEIKTILSTKEMKGKSHYSTTKLWTSPKRNYVLANMVKDGSIDTTDIYVIDLSKNNGEVVEKLESVGDYGVTWLAEDVFVYRKRVSDDEFINLSHKINTDQQLDNSVKETILASESGNEERILSGSDRIFNDLAFNSYGSKYLVRHKKQKSIITSLVDGGSYEFDFRVFSFVNENDDFIYVSRKKKNGWQEVVSFKKIKGATEHIQLEEGQVLKTRQGNREGFYNLNDEIAISYSKGHQSWVNIYSLEGELIKEVKVPSCCALTGLKKTEEGLYEFKFTSRVKKSQKFLYDLKAARFKEYNIESKMMTDENGIEFVNTFIFPASEDGKSVPTRIVHRKDLKLDGKNPAFVEGYGGFGVPGYLKARYQTEHKVFLDNGGVYVAPALRGGNELGEQWHRDAQFENKINTFHDGAAVLREIARLGYTNAKQIAITGTSNGGLWAAGMAMLYGRLFALAIPINGVYDLAGKDIFDRLYGTGWSYEYGTMRLVRFFYSLMKISPYHLAQESGEYPMMLMIGGNSDSRVRNFHTYKFVAAAQSSQQADNPILYYNLDNAGHWPHNQPLHDFIAIDTNARLWGIMSKAIGLKITEKAK